jgi:hypothetical protein
MVGQKDHFAQFSVHLNQGDDPAQLDPIRLAGGDPGQLNQVIAQNLPLPAGLQPVHDPVGIL